MSVIIGTMEPTNTYTKAEADARFVKLSGDNDITGNLDIWGEDQDYTYSWFGQHGTGIGSQGSSVYPDEISVLSNGGVDSADVTVSGNFAAKLEFDADAGETLSSFGLSAAELPFAVGDGSTATFAVRSSDTEYGQNVSFNGITTGGCNRGATVYGSHSFSGAIGAIDAHTKATDAIIMLKPGTWIIQVDAGFSTGTGTSARNLNVELFRGATSGALTTVIARHRRYMAGNNYQRMQCVAIEKITENTYYTPCMDASNSATSGNGLTIYAIRIA